jgi:hypothetical protein
VLAGLRNASDVVGNIVVLSVHGKVFKTEGEGSRLSGDWIESLKSSISKVYFYLLLIFPVSKLFNCCRQVLGLDIIIISKSYSLLFRSDWFWGDDFFKQFVICPGKRVIVIIGILPKL